MKKIKQISSRFLLSILFCCSLNIEAQQTINGKITHDSLEREYILYIPANYTGTENVPLLLNFHGYTSSATEQMFYGDFRAIAETEGFLIVHPMGLTDNDDRTHFNVGWGNSTVDDVGFTETLIDELLSTYNIDEERIYSVGMSNGGFMSYKLACELSNRIAAVASVTGSQTDFEPCDNLHQMPIMQIHGTDDDTVAYENSIFTDIEDVVDFWVNFNNCDTSAIITAVPDINTTDDSTVEHQLYINGDNGAEVEFYKIFNGNHTWPGAPVPIGEKVTNYDINASEKIWEFFSKYDINGKINTLTINDLDTDTKVELQVFPNPTNTAFYINLNTSKELDYQLVSVNGQVVYNGKIAANTNKVDIAELSAGIYFIEIENKSYKIIKTD